MVFTTICWGSYDSGGSYDSSNQSWEVSMVSCAVAEKIISLKEVKRMFWIIPHTSLESTSDPLVK
jgi:hypothetical protein